MPLMKFVDLRKVTVTGSLVCTLSAYGKNGSNNVERWVDSIFIDQEEDK
jgi:hypothetical protein